MLALPTHRWQAQEVGSQRTGVPTLPPVCHEVAVPHSRIGFHRVRSPECARIVGMHPGLSVCRTVFRLSQHHHSFCWCRCCCCCCSGINVGIAVRRRCTSVSEPLTSATRGTYIWLAHATTTTTKELKETSRKDTPLLLSGNGAGTGSD